MRADRPGLRRDAETFFVGDEFQSIYRFRHADVQVFIDRRSAAAGHVALRDNYRSRPEVLQFVNDLFGRVFGDEYRALEASRRFEGPAFEYPVELLVVDRSEAAGAAEWRAAEATLIAERVAAVVADGEHEPGDVVVLLRSGTDVETYEEALRAKGLETHRAIGRGYYGRQQVIDLCAYLRLVRNRYDDHALLAVLASPLVGVSNDGLLRIRRAAKYSLYGALERTLPTGLAQRDTNLLRAFRQRFDRIVALSAEVGLEELCERIVSDHDYDLACLAQPDGKRRYANVRKLVRLAREYETLRGPDLPGFLHFVDAQAGAEGRESEAAIAEEEGGDAVRLMTIHSAKGLEFPVVVVADCGRRAPSAREEIIALPEGSFGFRVPDATGKLRDPTAYRNVLQAEKEASLQEQRRVLYVAMTRAADRLLVSGAWAPGSKDTSPLGWIIEGLGIDPERGRHGRARDPRARERHARPGARAPAAARGRGGRRAGGRPGPARAGRAAGPVRRAPGRGPARRSRWPSCLPCRRCRCRRRTSRGGSRSRRSRCTSAAATATTPSGRSASRPFAGRRRWSTRSSPG